MPIYLVQGTPATPARGCNPTATCSAPDGRGVGALRQELAALSRPERAALAAAVARERALLEASPELAWLRSVQAAPTALGDARPTPPETPPTPGLALLLPGLPAGAPPDRLRVCGESPRGAPSRPADGRTARAVLELALPALGPTVASLALRGGALEVRIELADAAGAALVAARLPELGGTLAALGFEAATSAGPARTAALGGDGAALAAPARAVSLCA